MLQKKISYDIGFVFSPIYAWMDVFSPLWSVLYLSIAIPQHGMSYFEKRDFTLYTNFVTELLQTYSTNMNFCVSGNWLGGRRQNLPQYESLYTSRSNPL